MKLINKIFAFAAVLALAYSCGLDNAAPPKNKVSGYIVAKNAADPTTPLQLQGTRSKLVLKFYQSSFPKYGSFNVFINQDGKFEGLVFDGDYQIIHQENRGPWKTNGPSDTLRIEVKGDLNVNYPVDAYYLLGDAGANGTFALTTEPGVDGQGAATTVTKLTGSCAITKLDPTATIEYMRLYLSETSFVDDETYIQRANITNDGTTGSGSFTITAANLNKTKFGKFARIGLKITGKQDLVYTKVFKLQE